MRKWLKIKMTSVLIQAKERDHEKIPCKRTSVLLRRVSDPNKFMQNLIRVMNMDADMDQCVDPKLDFLQC